MNLFCEDQEINLTIHLIRQAWVFFIEIIGRLGNQGGRQNNEHFISFGQPCYTIGQWLEMCTLNSGSSWHQGQALQ